VNHAQTTSPRVPRRTADWLPRRADVTPSSSSSSSSANLGTINPASLGGTPPSTCAPSTTPLRDAERQGYLAGWRWGVVCGAVGGLMVGEMLIALALVFGSWLRSGQ